MARSTDRTNEIKRESKRAMREGGHNEIMTRSPEQEIERDIEIDGKIDGDDNRW